MKTALKVELVKRSCSIVRKRAVLAAFELTPQEAEKILVERNVLEVQGTPLVSGPCYVSTRLQTIFSRIGWQNSVLALAWCVPVIDYLFVLLHLTGPRRNQMQTKT